MLYSPPSPPPAIVEHLGRPCMARNVLGGRVVVDRKTRRELLVLTNMNETTGAELIFIDIEKNTARVVHAPKGAGSWAINEVPGDRLVIGTFYDGQFMVFDLRKMQFVRSVAFPGESYVWNLALGGDGRVYGGTYAGGKLGALDLNTYTVEDCGAPAPPNLYLRNVSPMPDGRVFCSFIAEAPTERIYDPTARHFLPVPDALHGVSTGAVWNGFFVAGAHAYRGADLTVADPPPFPAPPADKGEWAVDTYLTTPDVLWLRQGHAVYCFRAGDQHLHLVGDVDLRGGRLLAGTRKGWAAGVRGQDYFILKPGARDATMRRIPGECGPRPTHFLRCDASGTIWGGPPFGQTLFSLDPKTKRAANTSTVCDAGGEVYDAAFIDGTVYAAAYAGGDIVRYDPTKPWNQWQGKNPVVIASLGAKGYIRPTGGILVGLDGLLYSGWMAKYGTYGGAIAATNPRSGATDLIENPLGAQAVTGLALDAARFYVGTSLSANGLPDKKGEAAAIGVLDRQTHRVLLKREFPGAGTVRSVVLDRRTGIVAAVAGSELLLFRPDTQAFDDASPLGEPAKHVSALDAPGDGTMLLSSGAALYRLQLESPLAIEHIADLPAHIGAIAHGPHGEAYVACGPDIYEVKRP